MSKSSKVETLNITTSTSFSRPASKLKTYGFAIVIIMGIGGLAVAAAGLAGYFKVGALSHVTQVNAMIMMAAGGGGGATLSIIGVVGAVKIRQSSGHEQPKNVPLHSANLHETPSPVVVTPPEITLIDLPVSEYEYGPKSWEIWGIQVLDKVPETPKVDLTSGDKILLYMPQEILAKGIKQKLTHKILKEMIGNTFLFFSKVVEEELESHVSPGWILIDKAVIPDSRGRDYEAQKKMVEGRGCSMPKAIEAMALNLIVNAHNRELRLYGRVPITYTRCIEKTKNGGAVLVGNFGSDGLDVCSYQHDDEWFGVAGVKRFSVTSA